MQFDLPPHVRVEARYGFRAFQEFVAAQNPSRPACARQSPATPIERRSKRFRANLHRLLEETFRNAHQMRKLRSYEVELKAATVVTENRLRLEQRRLSAEEVVEVG